MTKQEYEKFADETIDAYDKFGGAPVACAIAEDLTIEEITTLSDMFEQKGFYSNFSFSSIPNGRHGMYVGLVGIEKSLSEAEKFLEKAGFVCETNGENRTWHRP